MQVQKKNIFHEILHCYLDFPFSMCIIGNTRRRLQGFLHYDDQHGQEGMKMMWILLAALVGVVILSVKEQLNRERDMHFMRQLSREYSL